MISSQQEANARRTTPRPFHILTVGDGDLSLSLALARAYSDASLLRINANNHNNHVIGTMPTTPQLNNHHDENGHNDDVHEDGAPWQRQQHASLLSREHPSRLIHEIAGQDHHHHHDPTKGYASTTFSPSPLLYPLAVQITASTLLPCRDDLIRTYPSTAPQIVNELEQVWHVPICYGVDATQLETCFTDSSPIDMIVFFHPHLGNTTAAVVESSGVHLDDNNERAQHQQELWHLQRHYCLLAHYLASAKALLQSFDSNLNSNTSPTTQYNNTRRRIHVCLRDHQVQSWRLYQAAARAALKIANVIPVQQPFHSLFPLDKLRQQQNMRSESQVLSDDIKQGETMLDCCDRDLASMLPKSATSDSQEIHQLYRRPLACWRRSRQARMTGKHWLAQFGYHHQSTWGPTKRRRRGQKQLDLSNSCHYIFVVESKTDSVSYSTVPRTLSSPPDCATCVCSICDISLESLHELEQHRQAPALPMNLSGTFPPANNSFVDKAELNHDTARHENHVPETTCHDVKNLNGDENSSKSNKNGFLEYESARLSADDGLYSEKNRESHVVVPLDHAGKRLRWFLQHGLTSSFTSSVQKHNHLATLTNVNDDPNECIYFVSKTLIGCSKRSWERRIVQGLVVVNESVVRDSSRIVQEGHVITIYRDTTTQKGSSCSELMNMAPASANEHVHVPNPSTFIRIVDCWNEYCHIVWKPVGMRTVGSFHFSTLEETFSQQQQKAQNQNSRVMYKCLCTLDTGVSGLCPLVPINTTNDTQTWELLYTFTALVHGHVPCMWKQGINITLPTRSIRRWKKKSDTSKEDLSSVDESINAFIQSVSETSSDESQHQGRLSLLSTVQITTSSRISGLASVIAYHLRKNSGCPIVGDRFATKEYQSLPRSMRNRIKQRLCMGITRIENVSINITTEHVIPEKWQCNYWTKFFVDVEQC